jgi:septation ring formation regulator EzrA
MKKSICKLLLFLSVLSLIIIISVLFNKRRREGFNNQPVEKLERKKKEIQTEVLKNNISYIKSGVFHNILPSKSSIFLQSEIL